MSVHESSRKGSIEKNIETRDAKVTSTLYLNFSFYKIDPKWRWLNDIGKEEAAKEFAMLIETARTKMKVETYSTMGLRKESEFMIWMISDTVEKMQILT
ncbi:MAG: chlorite dismutase family protein, partial [Nitrososphaeraceae archaeon]